MANHRKKEKIACRHYTWLLGQREGVYTADGRGHNPPLGRHSLNTTDRAEAERRLAQLDLTMAVRNGLIDPSLARQSAAKELPLAEGRKLYEDHAARPRVAGGIRKSSFKRYRAVLDKFLKFASDRGLRSWNQVTTKILEEYSRHLETKYAYATQYLELTTVKQIVSWLSKNGHLPSDHRVILTLRKPQGTSTYCWKPEEVLAMIELCRSREELVWLGNVIVALTYTGMRISELASLRWADIDDVNWKITLADESTSGRTKGNARTLKGARDRQFPIHTELRPVLRSMPSHSDEYVFHGPKGGRLKPDRVRIILMREVLGPLSDRFPTSESDEGFADGRLHSFRHFFCSLCGNKGTPLPVVMKWLGHRDSRMVQRYYHLHDGEGQRQMDRLSLGEGTDEPSCD